MLIKRCISFIAIVGLFACTGGNFVFSRNMPEKNDEPYLGVNVGFGSGTSGLTAGISLSHQTGEGILTGRFIHNSKLKIDSPWINVWDTGILYGVSTERSDFRAVVSAGISLTGGSRQGEMVKLYPYRGFERVTFYTPGLPIEAHLFRKISETVEIGLGGYANLNSEKSYIGWLLCIHFSN